MLVLSGSNTYSGGTVISAGTLVATTSTALPDSTSLAVGVGATFIFDPSVTGSPVTNGQTLAASPGLPVAAVPEPGTLALLGAAGIVAAAGGWRRKRS